MVASTGICEANEPLIDLSLSREPLIDLFDVERKSAGTTRNLDFFNDFEPELTDFPLYNGGGSDKIKYIPKRNFLVQLKNINTGEKLKHRVVAFKPPINIDQNKFDIFFRDWRENRSTQMDKQVLETLFSICEMLVTEKRMIEVEVTSGYRTKKTNEKLRQVSKNVARRSFHIDGKAIDFNIKGVPHKKLKSVADQMCRGGLGSYPGFFHIDTGPFRRWGV